MDLNDFFGPDKTVVDLEAENRWEAIDELVDHLIGIQKIRPEHRDAIVEAVKTRESSMTTGVGFGIAIPHATTELVPDVVGAIGRSRRGIQFNGLDAQPVNIVLLFIVPKDQSQRHLRALANIAKLVPKIKNDLGL